MIEGSWACNFRIITENHTHVQCIHPVLALDIDIHKKHGHYWLIINTQEKTIDCKVSSPTHVSNMSDVSCETQKR